MKEHVFVTGAAGFIGRYTVEALLKAGYEVTALVRKKLQKQDISAAVVEGDLNEPEITENPEILTKKCRIWIHLAANLNMQGSDQTILTNCLGTYHAIRLAEISGAKCFIYLSSIPVIGVPKILPVTEEHPIEPKTLYHITKYAGEQMVMQQLSGKMQTVVLRIPSPVGVGMNPHHFLAVLLRKCRKNETIELYGEGKRSQNYIDVRDIAAAVLCSIDAGRSGLYLIAGRKEIANRDLAFLCKELTGSSSEIIWGKREDPQEKEQWVISGEKAHRELGFLPQYDILKTICWMIGSFGKSE